MTSTHPDSPWTDERIEQLKQLWSDGYSCSQIADELRCGLSRNAVIGKVHRLGLSGRVKTLEYGKGPKAARKPRKPRVRSSAQSRFNPSISAQSRISEPLPQPVGASAMCFDKRSASKTIPIGQRCSILELTRDKCHWPIGDPQSDSFFFCGGKTIHGLPYCGYHSRMAYQAAAVRRQDRRAAR